MAARNSKRGFKRFLEDSAANKVDQGKSGCSYVRSKRFKTMFTRENVEGSDESGSQDQRSRLFGQALYQQGRQGLIVKYEDSGDNVYSCNHCDARFWFGGNHSSRYFQV
ncbi:hypothetical protein ABKV19_007921 [Rosa sericea]